MRWTWGLIAAALCAFSQIALAQTPEVVEAGKKATALVEIQEAGTRKGFGSAFCIDNAGIYITNYHVALAIPGAKLKLVLNPGEKEQRAMTAVVIRSDKDADLAVLQAQDGGVHTPLALGKIDTLFDTEEVTAFGFPFGIGLTLDPKDYPAISVNAGRITSLRNKDGQLDLVQIDAVLNPGNSGGPVIDGKGNVIGIVQAGLKGAGINFAIPISRLQTLLDKPIVTIEPTSIDYANRSKPQMLTIHVVTLGKPSAADKVELSIGAATQPAQKFSAALQNSVAQFHDITLVSDDGAQWLHITATFDSGNISGRVADQTVQVGAKPANLSSLTQIKDGVALGIPAGPVSGIDNVKVDLGNISIPVDLTKAHVVVFRHDGNTTVAVSINVTVKSGEQTVGQSTATIALSGAPGAIAMAGPAGDGTMTGPGIPAGNPGDVDPRRPRRPRMPMRPDEIAPAVNPAENGVALTLVKTMHMPCRAGVRRVVASSDGKFLVSAEDQMIRLWDRSEGTPAELAELDMKDIRLGNTRGIALSPDGKLLVLGGDDKAVRLLSVSPDGFKLLDTQIGHDSGLWNVAFAPDGTSVFSGADDMSIVRWMINGNRLEEKSRARVEGVFGVKWLSVTNDLTLTCATGMGTVAVIDFAADPPAIKTSYHARGENFILPMAVNPKDGSLALASGADLILKGDNEAGYMASSKGIRCLAWSGDGNFLAVGTEDGQLIVFDNSGKIRYRSNCSAAVNDVTFVPLADTPSEILIAAGVDSGSITLFRLSTAEKK